jgi:uncharacterized protein (TIGR00251 family)
MIEFQESDQGVIVPVRAQPKARRTAITGVHARRLRIAVTDPPEKGKANHAIAAVLADALHVRPAQVHLVAGAASPMKKFLVVGTTLESVRDLLSTLVIARPKTPRAGR